MGYVVTFKIMLVDDNRTFVAAVRQFLDMLPGTLVVGQMHNGLDALAQIIRLEPDLVLLDIAMPGLNGFDVAKSLQALPNPPYVVILSMHDSSAYRDAARDMGAAAYVTKADFVVDLIPIIDRLIASKSGQGAVC